MGPLLPGKYPDRCKQTKLSAAFSGADLLCQGRECHADGERRNPMNPKKTGELLKTLRLERGWTQADLADQLYVSTRSISRWENGTTLPDLSLLAELSGLYDISVDEILDGQKKETNMNETEMLLKAAEYSTEQEKKVNRRMQLLFGAATLCMLGYAIIESLGLSYTEPWESVASALLGGITGVLLTGMIYTGKNRQSIMQAKHRIRLSLRRQKDERAD